ncbi:MAG TPA: fused response regulator/phosphatase [Gemmataceae bacterium]|nr:fused response regulator/phosphatase [Gemmataceae bacterium]
MRVLIAWDVPREAELIALYLNTAENQAVSCLTAGEVLARAELGLWDAVLMSLTFPKTADEGYELFTKLQEALPDVPVVVGCRPGEMFALPRFLTHGLRFYINRDERGDFIFLVLSCVSSAVAATHAEEARKLAARLREEMDGVRRLQESIIPHGVRPPDGYRVAARYEPSQVSVVGDRPVVMAGGDYYDLFRPDESTLIVLIGDASGHGLKACMSIMTMHTLIRMFSGDKYRDTAAFVTEINQRLCENSIVQGGEGFITLFYAAIDTVAHTMTWTSAGHPLALVHNLRSGDIAPVGGDADGSLPLAISADVQYTSRKLELAPGSRVLIYSDGLTDAFPMNGDAHQAFGVQGVKEALRASAREELDQALNTLFQQSNTYTGGHGRHDDTSVLLLERLAIMTS